MSGVLPARHGTLWDKEEENLLIGRFDCGLKPLRLSELHERTVGSITSRLTRLGLIYSSDRKRAYLYAGSDQVYCRWFNRGVEEKSKKKRKKKKKRQ